MTDTTTRAPLSPTAIAYCQSQVRRLEGILAELARAEARMRRALFVGAPIPEGWELVEDVALARTGLDRLVRELRSSLQPSAVPFPPTAERMYMVGFELRSHATVVGHLPELLVELATSPDLLHACADASRLGYALIPISFALSQSAQLHPSREGDAS